MIQGDDRCVLTVYFPGSLTTGPKAANKLAELPGALLGGGSLTSDETEHRRRSMDLWRIRIRKVDFPAALGWVSTHAERANRFYQLDWLFCLSQCGFPCHLAKLASQYPY